MQFDELVNGSGFGKGYDFPPTPAEQATNSITAVAKRLAQRGLRGVLGVLGMVTNLRRPQAQRPALTAATFQPKNILVIRTDMLGDVVLTLPAVHALHRAYPAAAIDLLVQPATAGILLGQPHIARVLTADPAAWPALLLRRDGRKQIATLLTTLRATRYDLALSVCGDWASIVARLSGASRRVGFADEAYAHFLTDAVAGGRYRYPAHETAYGLALAAHAGGIVAPAGSDDRRPGLMVVAAAQNTVADLLAAHAIAPTRRIVALHAGSRNGQAKRWPLPYWARLADLLATEDDVTVVLVGAPGDKALAAATLQRMRHPELARDLTGQTSLPELSALLARCAVVVTGDSGPLHIAEAVRTPIVAIHGPTDPAQSGPSGPDAIVLRRDLWCSPCYDSRATAECRFANPICMKLISPAEVLAATRTQLARSPG